MVNRLARLCLLLTLAMAGHAIANVNMLDEPFKVSVERISWHGDDALAVNIVPEPDHFVYADSIEVEIEDGTQLDIIDAPDPVSKPDPILDEIVDFYDASVRIVFALPEDHAIERVTVHYLGCNPRLCYPPASETFELATGLSISTLRDAYRADDLVLLPGFTEITRETGYHGATAFGLFLDAAAEGRAPDDDRLRSAYTRGGVFLLVALVLLGGLALNLTPCVLPMIPVNLAIIGAGSQSGSRSRGLILGGAYGLGMTIIYGGIGLMVVLTRARFGEINAAWGFNLGIALLFFALALAMFDIISIDLSRFQPRVGAQRHSGLVVAFTAGGVCALLAGACVAPVVISVLLLSGELYGTGRELGLLLPFLLGLGMALPWPFAGAGLSILPKPGAWMNRVKIVFGILILLLAGYYARQAWVLGSQAWQRSRAEGGDAAREIAQLELAAQRANRENKPLLIDFWATWCKSCMTMERTTFVDPNIRERLERDFVFVKFQAEQPSAPLTRAVLDHFEVQGLPTYVVLSPPP